MRFPGCRSVDHEDARAWASASRRWMVEPSGPVCMVAESFIGGIRLQCEAIEVYTVVTLAEMMPLGSHKKSEKHL